MPANSGLFTLEHIAPRRPIIVHVFVHMLAFATLVIVLAHADAACAATITVTDTLDSGSGSLRQAVFDAAPGDTVVFDSAVFSVPLIITRTSGQIEISKSLVIDGDAGAVITPTLSGNSASRVFSVTSGVAVTLRGLRITDGYCGDSTCNGGSIFNNGSLSLTNSALVSNTAGNDGGAIFNGVRGMLTVINSLLAQNVAHVSGGGLYNRSVSNVAESTFMHNSGGAGGSILNDSGGTLNLVHSTVANSSGSDGGGIFNDWGSVLSMMSSTISGNSANLGGGLYMWGSPGVISNTTFSGNSTTYGGSGIYSYGGTLKIVNSTFVSNTASRTNGHGGGINNWGTLTMINSTMAGNSAAEGASAYNYDVGYARTILTNTIVGYSLFGSNCGGVIIDGGYNLDSGNTCGFTRTTSLTNTHPLLGGLGNNGGPVMTVPLLPGSPAIDAGDDTACPSIDARGIHRPFGAHCDIGAFEATFTTKWYYMPLIRR
jgi:hypothetical protein